MTQLLWIQWINWMTILVCTYNKPLLNYGILSAIFNTIRNLATTRIPTDLYTVKAFLLNGCANSMTLYFGGNVEGGLLLLLYTSFPVDTILTEETTFFALYWWKAMFKAEPKLFWSKKRPQKNDTTFLIHHSLNWQVVYPKHLKCRPNRWLV